MNPFLGNFFKTQSKQDAIPDSKRPENPMQTVAVPHAALQGDVAAIAIENVFQLFEFASLTGKLEVQTSTNSGNFFFRKGMLIHGLLRVNQRKIGQILLDAKAITPEQLAECIHLHEQAGARQRFGQILLDKGYAQPYLLDKSLLRQIKEAFFEALSWNEGTFRYYPDQMPPSDEIQMYGRIDRLLLEGMVYIDQSAASCKGIGEIL
jgi:hypothetical protein